MQIGVCQLGSNTLKMFFKKKAKKPIYNIVPVWVPTKPQWSPEISNCTLRHTMSSHLIWNSYTHSNLLIIL